MWFGVGIHVCLSPIFKLHNFVFLSQRASSFLASPTGELHQAYSPYSPPVHPSSHQLHTHLVCTFLAAFILFTPFRIISCMASHGWQLERLCSLLPGGKSWPGAAPVAICPEWNSFLFSFRPFTVLCTCFFLKQFKLTAMTTTKSCQEEHKSTVSECDSVCVCLCPTASRRWAAGGWRICGAGGCVRSRHAIGMQFVMGS